MNSIFVYSLGQIGIKGWLPLADEVCLAIQEYLKQVPRHGNCRELPSMALMFIVSVASGIFVYIYGPNKRLDLNLRNFKLVCSHPYLIDPSIRGQPIPVTISVTRNIDRIGQASRRRAAASRRGAYP